MLALMFIIPVSSMTGSAVDDIPSGDVLLIYPSSSTKLAEPDDVIYFSVSAKYGNPLEGTVDVTDSTSFTWDFGDGQTATGRRVSHSYSSVGEYSITVTGIYSGNTCSVTLQITVTNLPHAKVDVSTNSPRAYLDSVQFDASESYDIGGAIVSYRWDFGDGYTDTGAKVSHVFKEGTYEVVLRIEDNDGYSDTKTINIYSNIPQSRITDTEGNSTDPKVYRYGDDLKVFWIEGGNSIMMSQSEDLGWLWSQPFTVFDDASLEITRLEIASDGENMAMVVECSPPGKFPFLYVLYSSDGGDTWESPYSLRGDEASVDVVGENVYLAYRSWSFLGGPDFILSIVIRWTVDGHIESRSLPNPNGGEFSAVPKIDAFAGDTREIYVAVADHVTGNVYFWKSTDNGNTWSSPEIIAHLDDVGEDYFDIEATEQGVYFIWSNNTFGNHELWFNVYRNGEWGEDILLTNALGKSFQPDVKVDEDGYVHVIWSDFRDCNYAIYETTLDWNGNTVKTDSRITVSESDSLSPDMAIDSERKAALTGEYYRFEVWERDGDIYFKNNVVDGYIGQTAESLTATIETAQAYIASLPDDYFSNPAKREPLINKYDVVNDMIENGNYRAASRKVERDIIPKMDGFLGGNPNNDWIVVDTAQEYLSGINEILVYQPGNPDEINIWGVSSSYTSSSITVSWHLSWLNDGDYYSTTVTISPKPGGASRSKTFSYSSKPPTYFSYTFSGVSPSPSTTQYTFRISATEFKDYLGYYDSYGPKTVNGTLYVLITSGPTTEEISPNNWKISWTTNIYSTTEVHYGTSPTNKPNAVTGNSGTYHQVTLTGLSPGTRYYYTVYSTYAGPPSSTASASGSFKNPVHVTTGPSVSNISYTKATITWDTDVESDSAVYYRWIGETEWRSVSANQYVTHHVITIGVTEPLWASTTYEYYIKSTTADDVSGTSDRYTFETKGGLITDIERRDYYAVINGSVVEGIFVTWTTSNATIDNHVKYIDSRYIGTDESTRDDATAKSNATRSHHEAILSNVIKNIEYAYKPYSTINSTGETVNGTMGYFTAFPDTDFDGLSDSQDTMNPLTDLSITFNIKEIIQLDPVEMLIQRERLFAGHLHIRTI